MLPVSAIIACRNHCDVTAMVSAGRSKGLIEELFSLGQAIVRPQLSAETAIDDGWLERRRCRRRSSTCFGDLKNILERVAKPLFGADLISSSISDVILHIHKLDNHEIRFGCDANKIKIARTH